MVNQKGFGVISFLVAFLVVLFAAWYFLFIPRSNQVEEPISGINGEIIGYNLVGSISNFPEFTIEKIGDEPFRTGLTRAWYVVGTETDNTAISADGSRIVLEGFQSHPLTEAFLSDPTLAQHQTVRGHSPVVDGLYIIDIKNETVEKIEGILPSGNGLIWSSERNEIGYYNRNCIDNTTNTKDFNKRPESTCFVLIDGDSFEEVGRYNVWFYSGGLKRYTIAFDPVTFVEQGNRLIFEDADALQLDLPANDLGKEKRGEFNKKVLKDIFDKTKSENKKFSIYEKTLGVVEVIDLESREVVKTIKDTAPHGASPIWINPSRDL